MHGPPRSTRLALMRRVILTLILLGLVILAAVAKSIADALERDAEREEELAAWAASPET